MSSDSDLDAIAANAIALARMIEEDGSPELHRAVRLLLFALGREIARRDARHREGSDGVGDGAGHRPYRDGHGE